MRFMAEEFRAAARARRKTVGTSRSAADSVLR
jgi:hypothetical protein